MNNDEYSATQAIILSVCRMTHVLPLEDFIVAIDKAHAVGPIIDPTLYRAGMENLQLIEECARKLLELKKIILRFREADRAKQNRQNTGVSQKSGT